MSPRRPGRPAKAGKAGKAGKEGKVGKPVIRESNRMSRDEVVAASRKDSESVRWREWEKRVVKIGRANGWTPWTDRVVPYSALESLKLPRDRLSRLIGLLNRVGRTKGHPDVSFRKIFESWHDIPYTLLDRAFPDAARFSSMTGPNGPGFAPVAIFVYVECKTGRAEQTEGQSEFLKTANLCPGSVGYEARPEALAELVELMGGKVPVG